MSKTTTNPPSIPATDSHDPEVLAFRQAFDGRSPLDELVHEGARQPLQVAFTSPRACCRLTFAGPSRSRN